MHKGDLPQILYIFFEKEKNPMSLRREVLGYGSEFTV